MLTGTPLQNDLQELQNLLRFLLPDLFKAEDELQFDARQVCSYVCEVSGMPAVELACNFTPQILILASTGHLCYAALLLGNRPLGNRLLPVACLHGPAIKYLAD